MPRRSWYVNESELDDYQVKVIQRRTDRSLIIRGCAGSGKTILALWKAKQVQESKMGSYYVIVYTKALMQFMKDGIESIGLNTDKVVYHFQWEKEQNKPTADYLIVDEAQDFSKSEIDDFKNKAKKALLLYGDSAQQIYSGLKQDLMTMEEISTYTNFPIEQLVFNHRLPKKIARFAQELLPDAINDDLETRCTKEGNELPKILKFDSYSEQMDAIIEIIKNKGFEDVGILFSQNTDVERAFNYLTKKGLKVEARYSRGRTVNIMTLDFTSNNPKLMTYHSAKGLQFEAVFIPDCYINESKIKPLYVAITRSYDSLYIMHTGSLPAVFNRVPSNLYETQIGTKSTIRF